MGAHHSNEPPIILNRRLQFITFIDPAAAFTFYQVASYQGLTLNNRRLKVGWGKNSGPLSPALALAVHSGATRNVYIGGIEDFELFNEERLKRDFGEYGDIELVNYLKEKYVEMLPLTLLCCDNVPQELCLCQLYEHLERHQSHRRHQEQI